jgi:hypothetical protein
MDQTTKPTAAEMIKLVLEKRKIIDEATKGFNDLLRPYQEDIELLENLLGAEINRLGGQSIKTVYGTAYRTTVTSFRVADRQVWLDWVFANKARDMLTTHVAKDAIKDYQERTGATLPPGLNMTQIHRTGVRSPSDG